MPDLLTWPLRWLVKRWHRRQRAIDMRILWPVMMRQARGSRSRACEAMRMHMDHDAAWRDVTHVERERILANALWRAEDGQ